MDHLFTLRKLMMKAMLNEYLLMVLERCQELLIVFSSDYWRNKFNVNEEISRIKR